MENQVTRRVFLERALSLSAVCLTAAGICVCLLSGCLKKDQTPAIPLKWLEIKGNRVIVHVSQMSKLSKVGGAAKIVHPKLTERIIVVHPTEARYVALSGLCTHRGRPLEYVHAQKQLRCINFGHSRFSLKGEPLGGPASRSLRVYKTLYLAGKLEVFL